MLDNHEHFFYGDFAIVSEGHGICELGTEPPFEFIDTLAILTEATFKNIQK